MDKELEQRLQMIEKILQSHQVVMMQLGDDFRATRLETAKSIKESTNSLLKLQTVPEQIKITIECVKQINNITLQLADEIRDLKERKKCTKKKEK